MCGIAALFAQQGAVSIDALTRATRRLRHRGPDGSGTWVSEDFRVGLGHARLCIIDLDGGDQPIANEDGTRRIVVNGEFYDYERLFRELEGRDHRLRTRSDSEVALHLYEDYGVQCLHRLRGEFAFILWDRTNGLLFAARDRFGIKPLFYSVFEGVLYLASEAKAIFAAGVPASWCHSSFYQVNSRMYLQDSSLFEGVFQVPPGFYLLASGRHIQLHRYYDFDYPTQDGASAIVDEAAAVEAFRDVFDEAVRLRLRADVPVGCYLSGGLDSSAVLAAAARASSQPFTTFTLTFDDPEYDEGAIAREMACRAGADFRAVPVSQVELADRFGDAIEQGETLCLNAHCVAKYMLSAAVREAGYKVVLTGEGADEILAGYPHFRRDVLLYSKEAQDSTAVRDGLSALEARTQISRGFHLPHGQTLPLASVQAVLGFVPSWIEANAATAFKLHKLFSQDFAATFIERDPFRLVLNTIDTQGQTYLRDPVNQSMYLWCKTTLPGYILTLLGDRMEMAHSVEGRVPFLDHHVVEAARALPVAMKVRGAVEKYVLREAVRQDVTPTVYRRQKHPFLTPPAVSTSGGRLYELIQDTLRGPALAAVPFYDRRAVCGLLDAIPGFDEATRLAFDPVLMILLSACVLQESYRLGTV